MIPIVMNSFKSPEAIAKRSVTMRKYLDDPEYRKRMSENAKKSQTPEFIENQRQRALEQWSDENNRLAMSEIKKNQYASEEGELIREKLRQANLGKKQSEEVKQKKSEKLRQLSVLTSSLKSDFPLSAENPCTSCGKISKKEIRPYSAYTFKEQIFCYHCLLKAIK